VVVCGIRSLSLRYGVDACQSIIGFLVNTLPCPFLYLLLFLKVVAICYNEILLWFVNPFELLLDDGIRHVLLTRRPFHAVYVESVKHLFVRGRQ
jgi:hypothetical protein